MCCRRSLLRIQVSVLSHAVEVSVDQSIAAILVAHSGRRVGSNVILRASESELMEAFQLGYCHTALWMFR